MKLFNSLTKLLLAGAVFLMSSPAMATMVGSHHDLSAEGFTGEICNVCHTPHNANGATGAPLWSHDSTTTSFTIYTSTTLDATIGQPTGTSKLCLSCHDGTIAIDSFGGGTGTTFMGTFNAAALLDSDLSNDHPVSFTYDTALATTDGELFDPAVALSGLGSTINTDMLFSGSVECASCHDVHGDLTIAALLRVSNANSALCLTCHNK
jgi:predicted CXXCH cytochrome family protein